MGHKMSSHSKGAVLRSPEEVTAPQAAAPPYRGLLVQHHFINCAISFRNQMTFSFMTNNVVTSNIDEYYPTLAENCNRGLRLLTFYDVPGQMRHSGGLFNPEMVSQFQAVYCNYISPEGQPVDWKGSAQYELRIEKSVIQPQHIMTSLWSTQNHVATNTNHLLQTLHRYADTGARLICIEITGQEATHHNTVSMFQRAMPTMGCDLFFEVPMGYVQEKYVYTCVSVPIVVTRQGFSTQTVASCDWHGHLNNYLSQGWKLVEIFYDKSGVTQASGLSQLEQLNSQWFFEKPLSRVNDPTPRYQGTIVEHQIYVAYRQTVTNWEPVIQEMGKSGWELACILDTPETRAAGMLGSAQHQRMLLFLQRDIMYV